MDRTLVFFSAFAVCTTFGRRSQRSAGRSTSTPSTANGFSPIRDLSSLVEVEQSDEAEYGLQQQPLSELASFLLTSREDAFALPAQTQAHLFRSPLSTPGRSSAVSLATKVEDYQKEKDKIRKKLKSYNAEMDALREKIEETMKLEAALDKEYMVVGEEPGGPDTEVGKNFGTVVAKTLDGTETPMYKSDEREVPKVAGGITVGFRKVVVITGASSGLGLSAAKKLVQEGYFLIAAVRDTDKMKKVASEQGIPEKSFVAMRLELGSLQSVKDFASNLQLFMAGRPLDALVANAAIYNPKDPTPAWTDDGYEMALGVNHLGHFLLVQLLLPDLKKAKDARCIIVGSVTGNKNTIAGSIVKPVADLGKLEGLKAGGSKATTMPASLQEPYDGAKAYKDSKALNMITVREMHKRYHEETGISFTSLYPGCIAETQLFREKRAWFRKLFFPNLMKLIGAYVSEDEAGERLAQTVTDPRCKKSGVYWSWGGDAAKLGKGNAGGAGGEMFENTFSMMVSDDSLGELAYQYSMDAVQDFL